MCIMYNLIKDDDILKKNNTLFLKLFNKIPSGNLLHCTLHVLQ